MFIVAQVPFADFRPVIDGRRGQLEKPDWTGDDPQGFIRGFGKVWPRTSSSLGLEGERSFADMNNAIRFPERIAYIRDAWKLPLPIIPWFRRLYFDGQVAGRYEVGFMVHDSDEDRLFGAIADSAIDPSEVGQEILSSRVQINSIDGSTEVTTFEDCAKPLGLAYLAATTSNDGAQRFPIAETFGRYFFVGKPLLYIRIASGRMIAEGRDRRYVAHGNEPEFFITSARGSQYRNNVMVQASQQETKKETPQERVTRVLFSHLNSLIFAYAQLQQAGDAIEGGTSRNVLRAAITGMIERLSRFKKADASDWEEEFTNGLHLFARTYTGRVDELLSKLEALAAEWNSPTTTERFRSYFKRLHDLVITTGVEKTVEITMKGGI